MTDAAFGDLFPEFKQTAAALQGQFGEQVLDFIQHPLPFLGHRLAQIVQRPFHPATHVELADLVLQTQFLSHLAEAEGESSAAIQARVEAARQIQRLRFASNGDQDSQKANPEQGSPSLQLISCNADMRPAEIRQYCELDETSRSLIRSAMSQMQLSARAYHRILKLARTIADLAGAEQIGPGHLAEALQYRSRLATVG